MATPTPTVVVVATKIARRKLFLMTDLTGATIRKVADF